jgi:replicative DNA helicase
MDKKQKSIYSAVGETTYFGRIMPSVREVEEIVLGCLMSESNLISSVYDVINVDSFYQESNKAIFSAIQKLYEANKGIDIISVTQQLRSTATLDVVGGAHIVTGLTDRVASAANIEFYCGILEEYRTRRAGILLCMDTLNGLFNDTEDVFDSIQTHETRLYKEVVNIKNTTSVTPALRSKSTNSKIRENRDRYISGKMSGIPSGFFALDGKLGGWKNGELIVIGGRPGMGKSLTAVSFSKAAMQENKKVLFVTPEMTKEMLEIRFLASEINVPYSRMNKGNINDYELQMAENIVFEGVDIVDESDMNTALIKNICTKMKMEGGVDLIIVDYLHILGETREQSKMLNRDEKVGMKCLALKKLAKHFDIPVILYSQLNREGKGRPDQRPIITDLKESGMIEQFADVILFCHRPDYYDTDPKTDSGQSLKDIMEIIVAKNKQGDSNCIVHMKVDKATNQFWDIEKENYMPLSRVSTAKLFDLSNKVVPIGEVEQEKPKEMPKLEQKIVSNPQNNEDLDDFLPF